MDKKEIEELAGYLDLKISDCIDMNLAWTEDDIVMWIEDHFRPSE